MALLTAPGEASILRLWLRTRSYYVGFAPAVKLQAAHYFFRYFCSCPGMSEEVSRAFFILRKAPGLSYVVKKHRQPEPGLSFHSFHHRRSMFQHIIYVMVVLLIKSSYGSSSGITSPKISIFAVSCLLTLLPQRNFISSSLILSSLIFFKTRSALEGRIASLLFYIKTYDG